MIKSLGITLLRFIQFLITSCTFIAGFFYIHLVQSRWYGPVLNDPILHGLNNPKHVLNYMITSAFTYFIADAFMSVYEAAVDTLLLCYCMDVSILDNGIIEEAVNELESANKLNPSKIMELTGSLIDVR